MGFDDKHIRHFPGFSKAVAALLKERGVNGIATDTMSLDAGNNEAFEAHYEWLAGNGLGGRGYEAPLVWIRRPCAGHHLPIAMVRPANLYIASPA